MEQQDPQTADLYKSHKETTRKEWQQPLIDILHESHLNAALNNSENVSRKVFEYTYSGSGSLIQAICAGFLSTGGRHAPLEQARKLIEFFSRDVEEATKAVFLAVADGQMVPGFGNSFFKDKIDPSFAKAYDMYTQAYFEMYPDHKETTLDQALIVLNDARMRLKPCKPLYPNAAGITGAICSLLDMYYGTEISIFMSARSQAWLLVLNQASKQPEKDDHPELPLSE